MDVAPSMNRAAAHAAARAAGPALLLITLLLLPGAALAAEEVTIEGVLHVRNPDTPAGGTETWQLEEVWRAGGDDDEVFFGIITKVLTDDEGNVYMLDSQLSEVKVFSPDGEFLRTLSRQGTGPGEIQGATDMLLTADGNLGLVQSFPGKIIKIDLAGDPAGTVAPASGDPTQGGLMAVVDAQQAGGNLVMGGISIAVNPAEQTQTRTNFLASFDDEGKELARYEEKAVHWDFKNFVLSEKQQYFVHFRHWAVGPDGRVYAAPYRNRYAINVYQPDGTLDRVIEREYTSWERDERSRKIIDTIMAGQSRQFPFEIRTEIEETEADISSIHTGPEGTLWVRSSRSNQDQPDGIMMTYDVFDAQGGFEKQVAIACEGDGFEDGLFFAGDDRIIRVTSFLDAVVSIQAGGASASDDEEDDGDETPMEAICYRVHRDLAGGR
jgi:hypothetical protein